MVTGNVLMLPAVVMRPMTFAPKNGSVNQRAPSGPAAISAGPLPGGVGTENSVMRPAVVIRPILLVRASVNHIAPSGPAAIRNGSLFEVGTGNSLTAP